MIRKIAVFAGTMFAVLMTASVSHAADDVVFTIINKTNATLERFYTSPSGVKSWEDDVFGEDVLEPGQTIRITIRDGRRACKYDLRFEFADDDNLEPLEDTQDICKMGTYTLHH